MLRRCTLLSLLLTPQRQLALAAGGDGSLRVLDTLRSSPLLLLEPSAAGLLSAGWSPSRPLVFAAGSGEHKQASNKGVDNAVPHTRFVQLYVTSCAYVALLRSEVGCS
jgi:hypothetical protein